MAVEYNQHTWGYGEELTPDKFNNIEGGVKANADAINEVNNNLPRQLLWTGQAKAGDMIFFNTTRFTQYEVVYNTSFAARGMKVLDTSVPHGGKGLLSLIGTSALWTGENYITSQTLCIADVYDDHLYVNSIVDYASDGKEYTDNRAVIAVYGLI